MSVSRSEKFVLWSRLLVSNPTECFDRLATLAESRFEAGRFDPPRYQVQSFGRNIKSLSAVLKRNLDEFLAEPEVRDIENHVANRVSSSRTSNSFDSAHNADPSLARVCYALCRALKPAHVLETGVAYGVTTAFLLKAMEVNGTGHLWSIDLPPLAPDAGETVGRAVPEGLRSRWTLLRGKSHRILPSLAARLGPLDIFIHDSLHTYRNETFEFSTAWPHLRPGGLLIADDIETHPAWSDWERKTRPLQSVVFEEAPKTGADLDHNVTPKFGVMIKDPTIPTHLAQS